MSTEGPADAPATADADRRALGTEPLHRLGDDVAASLGRVASVRAEDSVSDHGPVAALLDALFVEALRAGASDLHIEPRIAATHVRLRVDGALVDLAVLAEEVGPALISRVKVLAGMNIVERRRPQDGQLSTSVDGRAVSVRVATIATVNGEKCVLRVLEDARPTLPLFDLGMSAPVEAAFRRAVHAPFGMLLCAGPTGSGKTTTLYAALGELADESRNVMTIEDPVEYRFEAYNQVQVNEAAGVGFATGLRALLRQDPDVILVGEIRDAETARIAVQSSMTGHVVLSSIHATDAVSALHRLVDMGIEAFLVASSLVAVVGQRLVRRVCPRCAEPYRPRPEELAAYLASGGEPGAAFVRGRGCEECAGTGYRGRVGVYELLRLSSEVRRLVVEGATYEAIRTVASSEGTRGLPSAAAELVARQVTTIDELIRSVYVS